jgi:hypothetical protein
MIQERAFFVVAIFPIVVGVATAATQHVALWRREVLFLLVAVAAAALCIWSPYDPRIPPDQHAAILLFVFAIPLSLIPPLARVRAVVMKLYRIRDGSVGVAVMAFVNFLVLLFASLGIGVRFGKVALDRLVLRAT